MKKLTLALAVLFIPTARGINGYQILDKFGSCMDLILSKGHLSEKDEKLFKEVASSLGIENRNIKPKNSGLLLRLIGGYNNALAMQQLNRVYFNASCLKRMSDGQKKFLMGHELVHHQKNHTWKRLVFSYLMNFTQHKVEKLTRPQKVVKRSRENEIVELGHTPLYYRYFSEGFKPKFLLEFSLKSLIIAQFVQRQETEADELAIQNTGATTEDAVAFLQHLYYPDTENWPLYAKIMHRINSLFMPILSLPIIKQHMNHLTSFKERAEHLKGLNKQVIENI